MLRQPVVAAPRFLSKLFPSVFVLLLSFGLAAVQADSQFRPVNQESGKYVAKIELNTSSELYDLLNKAKQWSDASGKIDAPVAFVLHGEEAKALLSESYADNRKLVDLAKELTAKKVVNLQVCRTWMLFNGVGTGDLLPFVETVPYAPSEIDRLISEQSYTYF